MLKNILNKSKNQNDLPQYIKKSDLMQVDIKSRRKVYYSGQAYYLSSINETGEFDVLPLHANFISLIKDYVKVMKPDGEIEEISIVEGVLKAAENKVSVYLDISYV